MVFSLFRGIIFAVLCCCAAYAQKPVPIDYSVLEDTTNVVYQLTYGKGGATDDVLQIFSKRITKLKLFASATNDYTGEDSFIMYCPYSQRDSLRAAFQEFRSYFTNTSAYTLRKLDKSQVKILMRQKEYPWERINIKQR